MPAFARMKEDTQKDTAIQEFYACAIVNDHGLGAFGHPLQTLCHLLLSSTNFYPNPKAFEVANHSTLTMPDLRIQKCTARAPRYALNSHPTTGAFCIRPEEKTFALVPLHTVPFILQL